MNLILPNFLIIGAARAGTTSIYQYLREHPEVFMSPVKETNFFAEDWNNKSGNDTPADPQAIKTMDDYTALFQNVNGEKAIGEASPWYLNSPDAYERIHRYIPNAKLIVILRDPAERAHSMFMKFIRDGQEPCANILDAIEDEDGSVRYSTGLYITPGFYYEHLQRFLTKFSEKQIKIFLYEDLCENAAQVMREIFHFLDVDHSFLPPNLKFKYNASGVPKNIKYQILNKLSPIWQKCQQLIPETLIYKLSAKVMDIKNDALEPANLISDERRALIDIYQDDIIKLQDFLKRDLSKWLQ